MIEKLTNARAHRTPSLISLVVSVDVKHHVYLLCALIRAQKLCEEGSGPVSHSPYHSYPISNKPYGFCGRQVPRQKKRALTHRAEELCEQGRGSDLCERGGWSLWRARPQQLCPRTLSLSLRSLQRLKQR